MKNEKFSARLRNRELLVGTIVCLPSPAITELLSSVGFDWLFIDAEHGPFSPEQALPLLQASKVPALIRVPKADPSMIQKALDIGATGVIVPQVNSAQQAQEAVLSCRYPPQGRRGIGLARAHGYGQTFAEYLEHANADTCVVAQVEHKDAVAEIENIVAVDGIDAILIGPYDLSASYGKPGLVDAPEVLQAIATTTEAAQRKGIALGFFGVTPDAVVPYIRDGFSLIAVATDTLFIGEGAKNCLEDLRQKMKDGN